MTVLITGASGFIGKHFIEYAAEKYGKENIVLLTSSEISGYKCVLHKDYTFTRNDFLDAGIDNIELVFHIGGGVPKNNKENKIENISVLSKNLTYTVHLIENLPNIPKKLVYTSSVSVYEQSEESISEDTNYTEKDLYGISKLMTEVYLLEKSKKLGFVLQILRLGQIYGEGEEKYSKIVSSFLSKLIKKETITVLGDGGALRSNLYVKDVVRYIYEASLQEFSEAPVNICSNQTVSIKTLLEICSKAVSVDLSDYVKFDKSKKGNNISYITTRQESLFPSFVETPLEVGVKNLYSYLRDKYGNC